jgi:hypothetical protein
MVAGSDALNRAIRAGDWAAAERALVQIGASALATIATATGLLGATESLIARFGAEEGAIIAEAELATPSVQSAKLQNIVDDLYKGTTNPGRVGTGTTADAIRYELETGEDVFGRSHIQKGEDYLRALENWLKSNPDAPYHDRLVARSLADDLLDALGRSR